MRRPRGLGPPLGPARRPWSGSSRSDVPDPLRKCCVVTGTGRNSMPRKRREARGGLGCRVHHFESGRFGRCEEMPREAGNHNSGKCAITEMCGAFTVTTVSTCGSPTPKTRRDSHRGADPEGQAARGLAWRALRMCCVGHCVTALFISRPLGKKENDVRDALPNVRDIDS